MAESLSSPTDHPEPRPSHIINVSGQTSSDSPTSSVTEKESEPPLPESKTKFPKSLQWIPANWTWSKIKPVIRCAVAAFIAAVLFIIPKVQRMMGQASFLILIASFLSPPAEPFVAVLEREFNILLLVVTGWAWSCLGMRLADLTRRPVDRATVTTARIYAGEYIETKPGIIHAVFIFVGTCALLYLKGKRGPGPWLFASVLGCICIDIALTTSCLYPYPLYLIGQAVVFPLALHSGIALLCSALVFPSTVSAQFTTRVQGVIAPLAASIQSHRQLLRTSTTSPEFSCQGIKAQAESAEKALAPLAASARLLAGDLIWGRFAPTDFGVIQKLTRRMAVRAHGMTVFFTLIDPLRETFSITPAASTVASPAGSRRGSRAPSPTRDHEDSIPESTTASHHHPHSTHSHSHRDSKHHHHHHHHTLLHHSLLHVSRHVHPEHAVGVFESQRYLNLEAHIHRSDHHSEHHTAQTTNLLSASCDDLLGSCGKAAEGIIDWLGNTRKGRWRPWKAAATEQARKERAKVVRKLHDDLVVVLQEFRDNNRHIVLNPYRGAFDSPVDGVYAEEEAPPHRYLFNCFVYQYHLLQFAVLVVEMLSEINRLEELRTRNRLWTPVRGIKRMFSWTEWDVAENLEQGEDEDPDIIQGMKSTWMDDLGMPRPRDPDALPPKNWFEYAMSGLYRGVAGFGSGNALFALKAGTLTVLLCIPSFLKSSAAFAYENKFVWAIFMGQLTLGRFRGETAFGLIARVLSTFAGGIVGMVLWYISRGNSYGLAAVCAVCFPFFFYARLYETGPPMRNIIFFLTTVLVIGYSYQSNYLTLPGSPGHGWAVAWRRFVLVVVGVTAATIFSFLPPTHTIRTYQRTLLSTTSAEIGAIYCSIVSYSNSPKNDETHTSIVTSLTAIRAKLNRSLVLRTNVVYEYSLRGRWPAKRYHKILEIQLQLAYCLSHLFSIVSHMEPAWSRAFLRRTRFLDADFQGDVLAVISLISTSLRSGVPLPQITPCPLLSRFMKKHHGLSIIHKESEDDYGLPRTLTLETLRNEQYLFFSVGISTAYNIITRLDRLMVAVKELTGEQYHIHGVGGTRAHMHPPTATGGVELGPRTGSVHFRASQV